DVSVEASQFADRRQITASQWLLARLSSSRQRTPGRIPVTGSTSRKISSRRAGSLATIHCLSATASCWSRREWLTKIRDIRPSRLGQHHGTRADYGPANPSCLHLPFASWLPANWCGGDAFNTAPVARGGLVDCSPPARRLDVRQVRAQRGHDGRVYLS